MKTYKIIWGLIALFVLVALMNSCKKDEKLDANTIKDVDGNVYHTITIGTQVWTVENLRTKHFRDGSEIPNLTVNADWANTTSAAYCAYGNDESNVGTYGYLYNWYAVADSRNICPAGFHIPSDAEWQTLVDTLGGYLVAGGKLKETGTSHWVDPNIDATDEYGFKALPGGFRHASGGFSNLKSFELFLTSTEGDPGYGKYRYVRAANALVVSSDNIKAFGGAVRCVKD